MNEAMNLSEVLRTAHEMIERFGNDALREAAAKADAELDVGEREAYYFWRRVVAAIDDLHQAKTD
jgi:hypothetical protein